jgi:hypothetical protein
MPKDSGISAVVHDCDDNRLLAIISGPRYTNQRVARALGRIIAALLSRRLTNLIATDGGWGDIDVSWIKNISDPELKNQLAENMFSSGELTAGEYIAITSPMPFVLFGADDQELHRQATLLWAELTPLWRYVGEHHPSAEQMLTVLQRDRKLKKLYPKFLEFNKLDHRRASLILGNVLEKMKAMHTPQAALICIGNLPRYIGAEAQELHVSHIIIDIAGAAEGDVESYQRHLTERLKALEE